MKDKAKINKKVIKEILNIPENKLDKELIEMMLKNIVKRVEKESLYNDSSWILEEYSQLQHSLDVLYTFIYMPKQSNLSSKDAQIFASYTVQQLKKLKDIVNILVDNKMNLSA